MRQICDTLGFHKSTFYYQPKIDPSEDVLRAEIETLATRYPTYGYRRITALLLRQGYSVGYKRVARLMKEKNLWVCVKRAETQTTKSLQGDKPWSNLLEDLEISHQDQVWVADITYVRLNRRFVYVALLMDVFTRMIRAWHLSRQLKHISDVETLGRRLRSKRSEDSSFRSRCAISFKGVSLGAQSTRYSDFDRSQRVSLGERIRRTVDPNPQGGRSSSQRLSRHPRSERTYWAFHHTRVSPETPAFGVRGSDTYGISTTNLILTLRNCGPNKGWHFRFRMWGKRLCGTVSDIQDKYNRARHATHVFDTQDFRSKPPRHLPFQHHLTNPFL